jgi:tRNA nucleotidyltransferase (CCA-adding enzyme)
MEKFKNINNKAIQICQTLNQSGFQGYIVGGCVRDLLLGVSPKDWDICTDANPEKIMELFPKHYPTGLEHGTITVAMGEGVENHFEVTTFRTEGKYLDGRRPESVSFVKNIKEDLARRDLTINAIAFDPISAQLVDPFNGINDLENKIIKSVGIADDRFKEDGLRLLRVARFAARFGYEIEEKTFQAIKNNNKMLRLISKERIKDEFCKLLQTKHAFYGLNILKETGLIHIFCRTLMGNFDDDFPPDITKCLGNVETKIALLYHKVYDWNEAEQDLIDLKFSNKEIKKIIFQLKLLHMIHNDFDKDYYIYFISYLKNNSPDPWEYTLNQFITLTDALNIDFKSLVDHHKSTIVFSRKELQINGNHLIDLGIRSGPEIKSILDKCYSEILKNPDNNNLDSLLKFVAFNTKQ